MSNIFRGYSGLNILDITINQIHITYLYFNFVWPGKSRLEYCLEMALKSFSFLPEPPRAGSNVGRAAVVMLYFFFLSLIVSGVWLSKVFYVVQKHKTKIQFTLHYSDWQNQNVSAVWLTIDISSRVSGEVARLKRKNYQTYKVPSKGAFRACEYLLRFAKNSAVSQFRKFFAVIRLHFAFVRNYAILSNNCK